MRLIDKEFDEMIYWLKKEDFKAGRQAIAHIKAIEIELTRLYKLVYELSKENEKLKEKISAS